MPTTQFPALAHFQLARVSLLRNDAASALAHLRRGLAFDSTDAVARQTPAELARDAKPAYTGQIAALTMLQHERQAQLWLMRRRLSDMYRWGQKDAKWAANANFESAFGTAGLLFPIPNVERLGNPCIVDPTKCQ